MHDHLAVRRVGQHRRPEDGLTCSHLAVWRVATQRTAAGTTTGAAALRLDVNGTGGEVGERGRASTRHLLTVSAIHRPRLATHALRVSTKSTHSARQPKRGCGYISRLHLRYFAARGSSSLTACRSARPATVRGRLFTAGRDDIIARGRAAARRAGAVKDLAYFPYILLCLGEIVAPSR